MQPLSKLSSTTVLPTELPSEEQLMKPFGSQQGMKHLHAVRRDWYSSALQITWLDRSCIRIGFLFFPSFRSGSVITYTKYHKIYLKMLASTSRSLVGLYIGVQGSF